MKIKKIILQILPSFIVPTLSLTTISCSNNESNINNKPIVGKDSLNASDFKLNKTISAVINQNLINENWIFENKEKLFNGSTNLIVNKNDIKNLSVEQGNTFKNSIIVTFELGPQKNYDENHQLTTKNTKIQFTIKNFIAFDIEEEKQNFVDAVKSSNFNTIVDFKNSKNNPISINNQIINKETQLEAIINFLNSTFSKDEQVVNNSLIEKIGDKQYRVAFSYWTQKRTENIFGYTWNQIMSKIKNYDVRSSTTAHLIFNLIPDNENYEKDSIVEYKFKPIYLSFIWRNKKDDPSITSIKPYWLNEDVFNVDISNQNNIKTIFIKN